MYFCDIEKIVSDLIYSAKNRANIDFAARLQTRLAQLIVQA
jgi:hypothetical protein